MAYTAPMTYTAGVALTAAQMNTYTRDNISWVATDRPRCKVYRNATQSISNATPTAIQFNAESWDNSSMHDNVTNNTRITIPTGGGGIYAVYAHCLFASGAAGIRSLRIYLNGVATEAYDYKYLSTTEFFQCQVYAEFSISAASYIEAFAYQASGGALNIESGGFPPVLSARWVGTN